MESLIINKRHELPIKNRLIWDGVTVLLWLGWIYLWKPFLIVIYKIITLHADPEEISDVIYDSINAIPVHHAVFMLIATPVVLFILSRLHRYKAPSEHLIYEPEDYAHHFNVESAQLRQCLNSQLVTVYHDDHGHITGLTKQITEKSN